MKQAEVKSEPCKVLQIGNYPPPVCGWSIQTKLLVEEIRRRGNVCEVLNLSENRRQKSADYVDVQNILDYLYKVIMFAVRGYRFQVHVNGQSKPGYVLALIAALAGRCAGSPVALSWRGGLDQKYFPRSQASWTRWAYQFLFRLAGRISCNSVPVKRAIEQYGLSPQRVAAIPAFSAQHLKFQRVPLAREIEAFMANHHPLFFCYVSFRAEYRLSVLREAMQNFRLHNARAGFIWCGFPSKEIPEVSGFVGNWPPHERQSLLLLGNLCHDEFLTLLSRSVAYIRTPVCDGVSASVLESLALGTPVVASENGYRPAGVVTYREADAADLCAKLAEVTLKHRQGKAQLRLPLSEDNISRTADWLLRPSDTLQQGTGETLRHAV